MIVTLILFSAIVVWNLYILGRLTKAENALKIIGEGFGSVTEAMQAQDEFNHTQLGINRSHQKSILGAYSTLSAMATEINASKSQITPRGHDATEH